MSTLEHDRAIIQSLGGPRKVAERLNMRPHGQQKVTNWLQRGIPAHMKVAHPELFMPELAERFGCQFPAPTPQHTEGA
jgi:hypothetical protein